MDVDQEILVGAAMDYMTDGKGSLRSIMTSQFPFGLPEESIAVALRACLIGLSFLHEKGQVHGDINAGYIFLNQESSAVQLDFATLTSYEHHGKHGASSSSPLRPATWTAAPEVYHSRNYTPKADIWQIGITALELAYGGLRVANRLALEGMLVKMIIEKRLAEKDDDKGETSNVKEKSRKLVDVWKRLVSGEGRKKRTFSKDFEKMVFQCLQWNPAKRPTVDELLQCRFFTKARDVSRLDKVIGQNLNRGSN